MLRLPANLAPGLAVTSVALLAVLAGGVATAQVRGVDAYDVSQLPETHGTLRQYVLNPDGEVDGLILTDGTEVKTPPHLSSQVVFLARPGEALTVRGLRARATPLVRAVSIRNDATGASAIDQGPDGPDEPARDVTGRVVMPLHGPRGEVNGALLDSGLTVRLEPREAQRHVDLFQAGRTITVRGEISTSLLGSVMEASAVMAGLDQGGSSPMPPPPREPRPVPAPDAFDPPAPSPPGALPLTPR